jgi:5-methylcytosine-specific restriction endonuclease McrA
MRSPGRVGQAWNRLRKQVLAEEPNCWLCGQPVDYHAVPRTRWAPSVDHIVPLIRGGSPLDRGNLHTAHHGCNASRKARMDGFKLRTSRIW